ncbi:MAG: hypothetical protein AAGA23_17565 [Pseudomonadota bacterium]
MTEHVPPESTRTEARNPRFRTWAVVLGVVLVALSWLPFLDRQAEGHYEQAFARALVTFGLARALNGVISVIQGTELSLQPAGVGVTLAPGELIDPVNDLIERFSWVMLASSTSLGAQKFLMDISAWWGVSVILTLGALAWISLTGRGLRWRRFALRFFLLAVFLRFAMPAMVLLNHGIYQVFMADEYETATQQIEQTKDELEELSEQDNPPAADRGLLESLGDWFGETADALNVRERMNLYRDKLANASEQFLRLAAVFLLQTVLLPLLFLWAFSRALRNIGTLLR